MPTPDPKPRRKAPEPAEVLRLFALNIERMRAWYAADRTPGPEVGANVNLEFALGAVSTAMEYALRGEQWSEPTAQKGGKKG